MQILILIHTLSGLIGIASGLVVVAGMFNRKRVGRWVAVFLMTTFAACTTGFCFLPIDGFSSAQLVGVFTTVLLALAAYSRYVRRLGGSWNQIFIVTAVEALYLNVLIAIAQSFQHFRFLRNLAPAESDPVYILTKVAALVLFIAIGFFAIRRAGGESAG